MKLNKIIKKVIHQESNNPAKIAVAVVAGLAVGAALAVIFAPEKGSDVRGTISDSGKRFSDKLLEGYSSIKDKLKGIENEEESMLEPSDATRVTAKKPKSDIKEIIHQSHVDASHTEQGMS